MSKAFVAMFSGIDGRSICNFVLGIIGKSFGSAGRVSPCVGISDIGNPFAGRIGGIVSFGWCWFWFFSSMVLREVKSHCQKVIQHEVSYLNLLPDLKFLH